MEKRAERPDIKRLVRKSSFDGRADVRSSSAGSFSCGFLVFLKGRKGMEGSSSCEGRGDRSSLAFFLVLKRFILDVLSFDTGKRNGRIDETSC
jgi:hypothetical protein